MDSAAEYLAEALACEKKADESPRDEAARALFLSIAARWRMMAESAAENESVLQSPFPDSLSA
jgi:hypothetical protein